MPNLQKTLRQIEDRLGEFSREILRIEAHLRRGEQRAALARIDGLQQQIAQLKRDRETPMQLALVGAQLGAFSGGDLVRGRLPAAILGALGGWMYGQSIANNQRLELENMEAHLDQILQQADLPSAS